jgi:hypothetical protein
MAELYMHLTAILLHNDIICDGPENSLLPREIELGASFPSFENSKSHILLGVVCSDNCVPYEVNKHASNFVLKTLCSVQRLDDTKVNMGVGK